MQFQLLLLLFAVPSSSAVLSCYSCATSNLRVNWALTGLPVKPNSMIFTDECRGGNLGATLVNKACPDDTPCIEMVIPTPDLTVDVVRGCYSDFFDGQQGYTKYTGVTTGKNLCYHYNLTTAHFDGYNAMHLCQSPPDDDNVNACNSRIRSNGKLVTLGNDFTCTEVPPTYGCYQCQQYDGRGGCTSTSESKMFKAPSCVKIRGTLSGHDYEERAPSYITPFDVTKTTSCVSINGLNSTLNYGPAAGSIVSRSKRDIVKRAVAPIFKGDICYCTADGCNSSPMTFSLPALMLFVTAAVPFFL